MLFVAAVDYLAIKPWDTLSLRAILSSMLLHLSWAVNSRCLKARGLTKMLPLLFINEFWAPSRFLLLLLLLGQALI